MPSAVTRPHCDAWEIAARATGLRDAGVGVAGVGVAGVGVVDVGVVGVGVVGVGTSVMASLSREPGWSAAEVAALSLRVNRS